MQVLREKGLASGHSICMDFGCDLTKMPQDYSLIPRVATRPCSKPESASSFIEPPVPACSILTRGRGPREVAHGKDAARLQQATCDTQALLPVFFRNERVADRDHIGRAARDANGGGDIVSECNLMSA